MFEQFENNKYESRNDQADTRYPFIVTYQKMQRLYLITFRIANPGKNVLTELLPNIEKLKLISHI
jgi:hypothetical protein